MTADLFQPGTLLHGKYRVERILGSGGMGVVVLATHLRMAQLVAIKVLRAESRDQHEVVQRFAREARAASRLRGEHAVRILDVDDSDSGDPFLVMEYLEGTDLHQALADGGPMPIATAVEYVLQACEGMAEAHAAGIVHRDLKPANLFLTKRPDGSPLVKVLDFGISKATESEAMADFLVTKPATTMGSPAYMSPEHLKNAADVDARTDIWSLGVVLYQLLTNALPFEATTTAALAARIAADPPVPLHERRVDAPDELHRVLDRCLEKSPDARFPDVASLASALAPFTTSGTSHAERIARVAAAHPVGSREATTSSPPREAPAGPGTISIVGSSTAASDGGVAPTPLEKAMGTEYASTRGAEPEATPAAAPRGRARWVTGGIAAVAIVVVAAAAATSLTTRVRSSPVGATQAPPPEVTVPAVADAQSTPASVAFAAPSVDSLDASSAPTPSSARPRRRPPPASSGGAGKNPMDIDFR